MKNLSKISKKPPPLQAGEDVTKYDAILDPYYRENETKAFELSKQDCTFFTKFSFVTIPKDEHLILDILKNGNYNSHFD